VSNSEQESISSIEIQLLRLEKNMSHTVLVTGGSGFIGSRVLRLLVERGDKVINVDIKQPGPEANWWLAPVANQISFVEGSVEDWAMLASALKTYQPDTLVHIAAIVNPVLLNCHPRLALKVNLEGTFNVLELVRLFGIQRLVYISSIGVLPSVQYQPIDSNHPVLLATEGPGTNFYGASKVSEEAFCWAYHQAFGLDFITLRPSAVYGFGMQWPLFVKPMVENSLRKLPTTFDHGREFPRDYTHVGDVAQIILRAIDAPADQVRDRTFYAATGQPLVTAGQAAETIMDLIPGADIRIEPGLSAADLLEIRFRGVLDISNAKEQLGYKPEFTNIRDGLLEYIQTYKQYLADLA
jgi:nucleoside-diphosphate-sugar epimerase